MENKRPLSTIVIRVPNNAQDTYFSIGENGVMIGDYNSVLGCDSRHLISFEDTEQMANEIINGIDLIKEYLKNGK
jgi:hypothetical protein